MSVEAMAQVWKLNLPRDQKLVLMAFADHANDTGYTYPSLARVAWKCGYQQARSVSGIVKKLLESGVLVLLEKAKGRTPTLYRIRWELGPQLPEFDPREYAQDGSRGAENAPLQEQETQVPIDVGKSLINKGENHPIGAENAPQVDGVRKTHPNDSVGVRFEGRRGAFFDRRGAVATAPEPLTINQRRAGARASESRAPTREPPTLTDAEVRKLNNSARLLCIEPKQPTEPLDHFQQRVDAAHGRKLQAMVKAQQERGEKAEAAVS